MTPSIVFFLTYALVVIPRSVLSSLFVLLFSDSTKPYRAAENAHFFKSDLVLFFASWVCCYRASFVFFGFAEFGGGSFDQFELEVDRGDQWKNVHNVLLMFE